MERKELEKLEERLSTEQKAELAQIRKRMREFGGVPLPKHPELEEPPFGSGRITADMLR